MLKIFLVGLLWAALAASIAFPLVMLWLRRPRKPRIDPNEIYARWNRHPAKFATGGFVPPPGGFMCCEHDADCEAAGPYCPDFVPKHVPPDVAPLYEAARARRVGKHPALAAPYGNRPMAIQGGYQPAPRLPGDPPLTPPTGGTSGVRPAAWPMVTNRGDAEIVLRDTQTPPGLLTSHNRRCVGYPDCTRFPCAECEIIR